MKPLGQSDRNLMPTVNPNGSVRPLGPEENRAIGDYLKDFEQSDRNLIPTVNPNGSARPLGPQENRAMSS